MSALFILTRIMGKKHISQLSFFDYVIGISIGSIAAQGAVDPSIHYSQCIVGLIVFTLFAVILSLISMKSNIGRKLLDGTPNILIQNGKIIESALKKAKLNINDLLEECRLKDAFNIADIEFAILETNGNLSVQLKAQNQPVTAKDMNLQTAYKGLCVNIIIDGRVLEKHLYMINKDSDWLNSELKRQGIRSCEDVLFAFVDSDGNLNTYLKNENLPTIPIF